MIRTRLHTSDTDQSIPAGLADLSSPAGAGASDRLTSERDDFAATLWQLIESGKTKDPASVSTSVLQPPSLSRNEEPGNVSANTETKPATYQASSSLSIAKVPATGNLTYNSTSDVKFSPSSRSMKWTYKSFPVDNAAREQSSDLSDEDPYSMGKAD